MRKAIDRDGDGRLYGRQNFVYDAGSPLPLREVSGVRATGQLLMDFRRADSPNVQERAVGVSRRCNRKRRVWQLAPLRNARPAPADARDSCVA